jgi:hypothetical protein
MRERKKGGEREGRRRQHPSDKKQKRIKQNGIEKPA